MMQPYVCGKNLDVVLAESEEHCIIAIEWFDNNYMKMNSDNGRIEQSNPYV